MSVLFSAIASQFPSHPMSQFQDCSDPGPMKHPLTWLDIIGDTCNFSSTVGARLLVACFVQPDVVEHAHHDDPVWKVLRRGSLTAIATSCWILQDKFTVVSTGQTCHMNSVGCPEIPIFETTCEKLIGFLFHIPLASFVAPLPRHSTESCSMGKNAPIFLAAILVPIVRGTTSNTFVLSFKMWLLPSRGGRP